MIPAQSLADKHPEAADERVARAQHVVLAAIVVLAAVALWSPLIDPFMLPKITVVVVGAVVLLALAAGRAVWQGRVTLPSGAPVWLAAVLAAALVAATVTAENVPLAVIGQHRRYAGLLSYLAYLAIFLVSVRLYADGKVRRLVIATLLALAGVTGYGMLQILGLDPYAWQTSLEPVFSTMGNTNFAAGYIAMACPVVAAVALLPGWPSAVRHAAGALLSLSVGYLWVTRASQGPVALAAGLGVVALAWWSLQQQQQSGSTRSGRPTRPQLIGGSALAAVVLVALGIRLAPDVVESSSERVQFWQAALGIFADHPLLGTGLDSFGDHFRHYRPAAHAVLLEFAGSDSTHNLPLGMLANGGILLALTYLAFVGYTGWVLVRGLRSLPAERLTALAGFGGMWAAYQVQSLVSVDLPPLTFLHFLSAGVIIALSRPPHLVTAALPGVGASTGWRAVALVGVLTAGLLAAWAGTLPLRADLAAGQGSHAHDGEAVPDLQRAVELAPWEPEYHLRLAQAYEEAGQQSSGAEAWIKAAQLRRGSSGLALTAAEVSREQGDVAAADSWVAEALRRDPRNPAVLERAADLMRSAGLEGNPHLLERRAEQLRREHGTAAE